MGMKHKKLKWPTEIFKTANSQESFTKVSGIGHWVIRID